MPEERRRELMAITDIDEHCRRWEREMNRLVNEAVVDARKAIRPTIGTRR
jgi:hypothetical protein